MENNPVARVFPAKQAADVRMYSDQGQYRQASRSRGSERLELVRKFTLEFRPIRCDEAWRDTTLPAFGKVLNSEM